MQPISLLIATGVLFVGTHFALSHPLRDGLARGLGERGFLIVYSVVAIATCLVPGLYPRWMVIEQVAFSAVLLLIRWILTRPAMKAAYRRPGQAVSSEAPEPG